MFKWAVHWLMFTLSGGFLHGAKLSAKAEASTPQRKPAVLLLHGIFDDGRKMDWLSDRLREVGYETFAPSLKPSSGKLGLVSLSMQFHQLVQTHFTEDREFHVVGFSMGGLITRHWLQNHANLRKIKSFTTLGTPHRGTITAHLLKNEGSRDMRPQSRFIAELESKDACLEKLNPLSLYTPLDLIIVPSSSSKWKSAAFCEEKWLLFHPQLCYSKGVLERILEHFEACESDELTK